MKTITIVALLGMMSTQVFAKDIFLLTKSIRYKNKIHYDVKVKECRMTDKPLSAFWILGEKQGQVQQLKPDEVIKYAPVIVSENGQELEFTLPIFNEIDNPIVDNPILVKLVNCEAKAFIKIDGQEIELNEIFAKISLNPFNFGVKYLEIKGKKRNGSAFTHKIDN